MDEQGLIRCTSRLENSCLLENAKFPKLLPRRNHFSNLVILENHLKLLHSGVSHTLSRLRQEYWLAKGRTEVRRVIINCKICKRFEGGPYKLPVMASLPKNRVFESPPFTFTGLDYLGPLYTTLPKVFVHPKIFHANSYKFSIAFMETIASDIKQIPFI